jgi:hypothetical protein
MMEIQCLVSLMARDELGSFASDQAPDYFGGLREQTLIVS